MNIKTIKQQLINEKVKCIRSRRKESKLSIFVNNNNLFNKTINEIIEEHYNSLHIFKKIHVGTTAIQITDNNNKEHYFPYERFFNHNSRFIEIEEFNKTIEKHTKIYEKIIENINIALNDETILLHLVEICNLSTIHKRFLALKPYNLHLIYV